MYCGRSMAEFFIKIPRDSSTNWECVTSVLLCVVCANGPDLTLPCGRKWWVMNVLFYPLCLHTCRPTSAVLSWEGFFSEVFFLSQFSVFFVCVSGLLLLSVQSFCQVRGTVLLPQMMYHQEGYKLSGVWKPVEIILCEGNSSAFEHENWGGLQWP